MASKLGVVVVMHAQCDMVDRLRLEADIVLVAEAGSNAKVEVTTSSTLAECISPCHR